MTEQYCKVDVCPNGKLYFIAPATTGNSLNEVIEDDKRYGKMSPANGEYFTWKVFDGDDEFDHKKSIKSIQKTIRRFEIRLNIKFKYAKDGEVVDFKIYFRTTENDNILTANTLMYHYFPINSLTNEFRGVCVVNKEFHWTTHGKGIPLDTGGAKMTYDFDQVYTHELGHGLGLPHSKLRNQVMSPNYGIMAEWLTKEEDLPRLWAKYPKRIMSERRLTRWLKWIYHASER